MRNIVFVRKPGKYKEDYSWCGKDEWEAEKLQKWLKILGIEAEILTESEHDQLPERQPWE